MNSMRMRQNYRESEETVNLMRTAFYAGAEAANESGDPHQIQADIYRFNNQQQEQQPNSIWYPKFG